MIGIYNEKVVTLPYDIFAMTNEQVDIKENDIFELSPEVLGTLLKDHAHNGTYALIKDWRAPKNKQKIRFIDLMK